MHHTLPSRRTTLHTLASIALAAGACALATASHAQTAWPTKPVRIVVPFAPGGTTDILARAMAPELSKAFGQQFIVDNRAGAGGNVGAEVVAKSPGDGYTLLMGTVGTHGINRALYAKLPFNADKDFTPVSMLWSLPNLLIVRKSLGPRTVTELIAQASRAAPPGTVSGATQEFTVPTGVPTPSSYTAVVRRPPKLPRASSSTSSVGRRPWKPRKSATIHASRAAVSAGSTSARRRPDSASARLMSAASMRSRCAACCPWPTGVLRLWGCWTASGWS